MRPAGLPVWSPHRSLQVRFFLNGVWTNVVVDDRFAMNSRGARPASSSLLFRPMCALCAPRLPLVRSGRGGMRKRDSCLRGVAGRALFAQNIEKGDWGETPKPSPLPSSARAAALLVSLDRRVLWNQSPELVKDESSPLS